MLRCNRGARRCGRHAHDISKPIGHDRTERDACFSRVHEWAPTQDGDETTKLTAIIIACGAPHVKLIASHQSSAAGAPPASGRYLSELERIWSSIC